MAHFTFRGGIKLRENKDRTKNLAIEEVLPGKTLLFPLNHQEKPLVIPGEYVLAGQLLARAEDESMSRVHCSVSGFVEREMISGETIPCIVIENDENYKEIDFGDFVEADDLDNRQILTRIMSAGVVDSNGSGEPFWQKLDVKEPNKIRHIIVNCVESEPYLTSRYRCCVERPEWIVEGLRIILKMFPNAKGILAVENGQQEAITSLQKILADSRNMKIIPMKCKYPQDAERMLIYACTGKQINSHKTAEDARCIVMNSDTVYAICNAVTFGKPMYKRLITVSGECIEKHGSIRRNHAFRPCSCYRGIQRNSETADRRWSHERHLCEKSGISGDERTFCIACFKERISSSPGAAGMYRMRLLCGCM